MEASVNSNHSYSHDQLAKTIFEMELRNPLFRSREDKELIEAYLKERIEEIKKRWS